MTIDQALLEALTSALEPLPDEDGGIAIVLATAASPPALALLSSGDVHVEGGVVRAVTYRGSSVSRRLGDGFSLLVPTGEGALRVEATEATVRHTDTVELIEGRLDGIHPTTEPPWLIDMSFRPEPDADTDLKARFLAYWSDVRSWLDGDAAGRPPDTGM